MAALVWFTTGVAIWHFTVFIPDRFWAGIVGAIGQILLGQGIGETGIETVLFAIPGTLLGLGLVYMLGVRQEEAQAELA
jgi:hypothetical protein